MKLTKRQLDEIIKRELNEGFFDSISNIFKTKATKEKERKEEEDLDRAKIREYYGNYLRLEQLSYVYHDQTWHKNYAYVCKDINGKKTLWYKSGREKILVQIAGIAYYPMPPNHELSPGHFWICKSTPKKRPYGRSNEEKIYMVLNTYVNGFDTRDAFPYPHEFIEEHLSESGKKNFKE